MTVNQILALCLVLVLVGFIVVLAVMAKHAIELMKTTKGLVNDGQEFLDDTKKKVNDAEDKIIGAAVAVAEDTAPTIKVLGATAGGITAISMVRMIGRGLLHHSGIITSFCYSCCD